MIVETICVGTELLLGDVVNTNAAYLAKQIAMLGFNSYHQSVVGDNVQRLKEQLDASLSRSDFVILTGGLGPTYDDMTKETVAEYFGELLVFDESVYQEIAKIFEKSSYQMTENNRKQAYVFESGRIFHNLAGTAPGLMLSKYGKHVALLPGPPKELMQMFEHDLLPVLKTFQEDVIVSRSLHLMNIGESLIESQLYSMMLEHVNPTIAPYAKEDGVMLRVTAKAKNEEEAIKLIDPVIDTLAKKYSQNIYSKKTDKIEEEVAHILRDLNQRIYVFEGVSGGILSSRLSDIAFSGFVSTVMRYQVNSEKKSDIQAEVFALTKDAIEEGYTAGVATFSCEFEDDEKQYDTCVCAWYDGNIEIRYYALIRGYVSDNSRQRNLSSSYALKTLYDLLSV